MSDPHFNIFHAYRGVSRTDEAAARQLEDNFTRALAITLRAVRGTQMQVPLLELLGFDPLEREDDYQTHLQVTRPPSTQPARRTLVVIHGGPALHLTDVEGTGTSSRADAVVMSRRSMIVIESKLENVVARSQLNRHRAAFGIPATNVVDLTWSTLTRSIRTMSVYPGAHSVARFVLSQFEEYLTMNGFGGLTYEHFIYFALPPEQRDPLVKDGIRRSLEEIGDQLVASIPTSWNYRVLNIASNADYGVVVIEREQRQPHLTVLIHPAGLNIHTNIELEPPYQRFRKALADRPDGFTDLLRRLGKHPIRSSNDLPWRFRVERRIPLGRPREYHYYPVIDIAATIFQGWEDSEIVEFIETTTAKPPGEAAPGVLVVKTYPLAQVTTADDLGVTLLSDIREIEPFFDWIGEPIRVGW